MHIFVNAGAGTGDLVLDNTIKTAAKSGDAIVLSAAGAFDNEVGASALSLKGTSRWLIYSNNPANDVFGGLDSANTAIWNTTYNPPNLENVTQMGDRYLFAYQPTLTFTSTSLSKTYGVDDTAAVASAYTVSGLQAGVAGAFLGDTLANVYSGAPTLTSSGSAVPANVAGSPYTINIAQGSVSSLDNYALAFVSSGQLTVDPATLTITANDQSKTYGTTLNLGTTAFTETGLVTSNGDSISGVTLSSLGAAANATVAGGPYAITPSNATGTGLGNYTIAYNNAPTGLTVNPAALTITANDQSKTYGTTLNLGTIAFTETGLVTSNGDSVSGVTLSSLGAVATANVAGSPYAITPSNATGTGLGNYTIVYNNAPTGLTVNAATLTITANDQSKTYGTTLNLGTIAFTETGLVSSNGDSISGVTLSSLGAVATANVAGSPYAITPSNAVGTGLGNYTIAYNNAPTGLTVNAATLTITANDRSKTYGTTLNLGTSAFTETGLVTSNGDSISGVTLSSLGAVATANVAGSPFAITPSNATGTGLSNYTISYNNAPTGLTVNPASVVVTALGGSSIYGSSPSNPGLSATGLQNGENVSVLTGLTNSFGITATSNAGSYVLSVSGTLTNPNYQVATTIDGSWTVNPAILTYVATPTTRTSGTPNPTFTGTVTGFVNGQTVASATTGALLFSSPATSLSPPGSYAIDGSGLSANNGNYIFVQAAGNATALTLNQAPAQGTGNATTLNQLPADPPSHFTASTNGTTSTTTVNINFSIQNPNLGTPNLVHITFTPTNNEVSPAALPPGDGFTRNHGFDFQPISQYDANQYSQFKLPDYDDLDGEATIFTIIARAVAQDRAAEFMIDGFWNGTGNDWNGATGANPLVGKVIFSDGAGHDVAPTEANAFPIVAGKTDFAQLLKSGPLMIGGAAGQTPAEWLLATGLTPDGKGIVCDDPITGKLVEFAYDPTTETIGGIVGIFSPKTKGFVALADAGSDIPAGVVDKLPVLQGFVPSTFFAVTVK